MATKKKAAKKATKKGGKKKKYIKGLGKPTRLLWGPAGPLFFALTFLFSGPIRIVLDDRLYLY
jgi:hypothetical protein